MKYEVQVRKYSRDINNQSVEWWENPWTEENGTKTLFNTEEEALADLRKDIRTWAEQMMALYAITLDELIESELKRYRVVPVDDDGSALMEVEEYRIPEQEWGDDINDQLAGL